MLILEIIGWTCLIGAWTLPKKWFKNEQQKYAARMVCNIVAIIVFSIILIKVL